MSDANHDAVYLCWKCGSRIGLGDYQCDACASNKAQVKVPPPRQYWSRDPRALDRKGGHYSRHVSAMTAEGLHDKSKIAAELAYRDWKCAGLKKANYETEQILGRALGYPLSPGSDTDICVGDHVTETLAEEAAKRIAALEDENAKLRELLKKARSAEFFAHY